MNLFLLMAISETFGYSVTWKQLTIGLAMMQYSLHCYMVFALHASDENFLIGDSDNIWLGLWSSRCPLLIGIKHSGVRQRISR